MIVWFVCVCVELNHKWLMLSMIICHCVAMNAKDNWLVTYTHSFLCLFWYFILFFIFILFWFDYYPSSNSIILNKPENALNIHARRARSWQPEQLEASSLTKTARCIIGSHAKSIRNQKVNKRFHGPARTP
jgi:hypothetical protein